MLQLLSRLLPGHVVHDLGSATGDRQCVAANAKRLARIGGGRRRARRTPRTGVRATAAIDARYAPGAAAAYAGDPCTGSSRLLAHADRPAPGPGPGRGPGEPPARGPVILAVEPPIVPRFDLHPARRPAPGDLRCQGRVLRRRQDGVVLPQLRSDPDPARRRERERARAGVGDRGVAGREGLRDLSGGHPHARRAVAPRPHGGRPARVGAATCRSCPSASSAPTTCSPSTRACRSCSGVSIISFGEPIDPARYAGREHDRMALREITDEVMYEIAQLSRLRVRRHVRDQAGRGSPDGDRAQSRASPTHERRSRPLPSPSRRARRPTGPDGALSRPGRESSRATARRRGATHRAGRRVRPAASRE